VVRSIDRGKMVGVGLNTAVTLHVHVQVIWTGSLTTKLLLKIQS
jgi:hypothetical protein